MHAMPEAMHCPHMLPFSTLVCMRSPWVDACVQEGSAGKKGPEPVKFVRGGNFMLAANTSRDLCYKETQ